MVTQESSCKARLLVVSFLSFTWVLVTYFKQNKDTPWFPFKLWLSAQPWESFLVVYSFGWDTELQSYRSIIKFHVMLFTKIQISITACQCNLSSWSQHFLFAYSFPLLGSWETALLSQWLLSFIWHLVTFGEREILLYKVWVSCELSHGNTPWVLLSCRPVPSLTCSSSGIVLIDIVSPVPSCRTCMPPGDHMSPDFSDVHPIS